jgi:hypothetical protein
MDSARGVEGLHLPTAFGDPLQARRQRAAISHEIAYPQFEAIGTVRSGPQLAPVAVRAEHPVAFAHVLETRVERRSDRPRQRERLAGHRMAIFLPGPADVARCHSQ